jgi:hypothetical protein
MASLASFSFRCAVFAASASDGSCRSADALDLKQLSFDGMVPEATGRPSYHPSADKRIDHANGITLIDPVIQAFRQQ